MANNLTLASPDIQDAIKMLREKAGANSETQKTPKDYEREIALLNKRIDLLLRKEYKDDLAFRIEAERAETFLCMLESINGEDLKKAVSLIVYWDKFAWLPCYIIERMRNRNERLREFLEIPRHIEYIRAMDKYVDTDELADALKVFGYKGKAKWRARDRSKNCKEKSKGTASKKGSK